MYVWAATTGEPTRRAKALDGGLNYGAMTVVLLDERWPTLIPMEALGQLRGPVSFTSEVPIAVRWNFADAVVGTAGKTEDAGGGGVLVSTNAKDPEVKERIAAGDKVFEAPSRKDPLAHAQQVMARALTIGEWEMAQTHESLLPYLEEEASEFAQAVRTGAEDEVICRELADVFLQVLFHAEIASRRGSFALADVAQSFVDKMKSRAPYLFDGTRFVVDIETQERLWAEGKAREVGGGEPAANDGA